jgi:hypothetical protein
MDTAQLEALVAAWRLDVGELPLRTLGALDDHFIVVLGWKAADPCPPPARLVGTRDAAAFGARQFLAIDRRVAPFVAPQARACWRSLPECLLGRAFR